MWNLLPALLVPVILYTTHAKLVGDHICQSEVTEPVEFTEWTIRNGSARNYQWCWNVPPRCSTYTTKLVNETRIVIKNITKNVEHCCEGFQAMHGECVSLCPACINGICKNGKCICSPGWKGATCDSRCLIGDWGSNCTRPEQECDCLKYVQCHSQDAKECDCVTGWLPDSCSDLCPKPYFGKNCSETCKCNLHSEYCLTDSNQCGKLFIQFIQENIATTKLTESSDDITTLHSPDTAYFFEQIQENTLGSYHTRNGLDITTSSNTNSASSTLNVNNSDVYDVIQSTTMFSVSQTPQTTQKVKKINTVIYKTNPSINKNVSDKPSEKTESKIFRVKIFSTIATMSSTTEKEGQHEYPLIVKKEDTEKVTTDKGNKELQPVIIERGTTNKITTERENEEEHKLTRQKDPTRTVNIKIQHEQDSTPNIDVSVSPRTFLSSDTELQNHVEETSLEKIETTTTKIIVENNNYLDLDEISHYETDLETHLLHESLTTSIDILKENRAKVSGNADEDNNYFVVQNVDHNFYSSHNRIIQYVSIVAVVTLIVITIIIGLLVLKNTKKNKNDTRKGNVNSTSTSTVAVYTTSIFHSPLPEPPPTLENPTYLKPEEYQNNSKTMRTFQTEMVCSMDFKTPTIKEIREYTYDYPPSTGSYRPASTIDAVSEVDIAQKLGLGQSEPVYDEIPSMKGQNKTSPVDLHVISFSNSSDVNNEQATNLYMNTCESTRL